MAQHLGIGFPFAPREQGFLQMKSDRELIHDHVIQIVGTEFNERFFRPDLGSGRRSLLFRLNDLGEGAKAALAYRLDTILQREPRARLRSITFILTPELSEQEVVGLDLDLVLVSTGEPLAVRTFIGGAGAK
jgi:phage baseplate assembly protein W